MAIHKVLHIKLQHDPVSLFLGIQPKRNENIGPHKNVYVHSSIMHNRKKVETMQMSFNWMDKQMWYSHTVKYYPI